MLKHCEICGRDLPESEFSKSYKNRCKKCVAELTRNNRHQVKTQPQVIDWEARRYDLTKAAMVAMIDKKGGNRAGIIAMDAVEIADKVIEELKGCK